MALRGFLRRWMVDKLSENPMKKCSLILGSAHGIVSVLTLVALLESKVFAAGIAEDSFEATPVGALSGASGGTGWGGSWGAPISTAIANVVDASGNPLAFTPVGGLPVNGGTHAVEVYSSPISNVIATARQIATTLPGVFYVSYLVRVNAGAGWGGNNTFSLHMSDSATNTASINFGIRGESTTGRFMVRSGTGAPAGANVAPGAVAVGTSYFLVARFSKIGSTGAASATYDRCEIWVNPAGNADQTAANGDARLQLATGAGLGSLTHVLLRQAALDADDRVWFDALTIGTNWTDVVPLPVDTNAPVVTITNPGNNAIYAPGIPINVAATVTDDRALSLVQLYTNGAVALTDNTAPYSFTLTGLPSGPHLLTVVATDTSGNVGSNSISLLVTNVTGDTTPPVVSITSPTNGQNILLGVAVSVAANVTDNVAVAYAELYADGALVGSDASSPYQFAVSNLLVGVHSLAVRGVDTSGNLTTNSIGVTVYTNPPVASAPFAQDSFESYAVGALSGKNGGSGWTGAWTAPGAGIRADVVDTTANPLSFTPSGGSVINGGTRALEVALTAAASSQLAGVRTLAAPLAKTFYASYLVRYTGAGNWDGANNTFTLHMGTNASSAASLNFGLRGDVNTTNSEFTLRYSTASGDPRAVVGGQLTNNTTYLLVVKMEHSGTAFTNALMWLNPTATDNVDTPAGDARLAFSCGPITHLFFREAALDANDILQADEVKIGTNWVDVVPSMVAPPKTQFYPCIALPAFFAGMNLFMTNAGGVNFIVWSSPNVGPSVTNWTMEGSMVETPLNDNSGFSRYALNVIPAVSPVYYLISMTTAPPYAALPVPILWINTDINSGEYTFTTTTTTISANGMLGLNTAPVALADNATTSENMAVTINVLANDSDADPNTVLSLVSASSGNGTVVIAGTNLLYTPAPNFNGTNVFSYVVTDGSLYATGYVAVVVTPLVLSPPTLGGIAWNPDRSATLSLSVPVGQMYRVQAATNLVAPVMWEGLITNISSSTNMVFLTDTNTAGFLQRFYRVVSP